MELPLQVTFRDVKNSDTIRELCEKEAQKLGRFHDRITSCRVTIDAPHRHHQKGALYSVGIDLVVPGGELVVNRPHHDDHAHEELPVAIRDAFRAARRQLEVFTARQRHA